MRKTVEHGVQLFSVLRSLIKYAFEKLDSQPKRGPKADNTFADLKFIFNNAHFLMLAKFKGMADMQSVTAILEASDNLLPSGEERAAAREDRSFTAAGIDGASSQ